MFGRKKKAQTPTKGDVTPRTAVQREHTAAARAAGVDLTHLTDFDTGLDYSTGLTPRVAKSKSLEQKELEEQ